MQLRKICQHPFLFESVEDRVNPTGFIDEKLIIDLSVNPKQGDSFFGLGTVDIRTVMKGLKAGTQHKVEVRLSNQEFIGRGAPFTTRGVAPASVYSASIMLLRVSGRSSGARGVRQSVVLPHTGAAASACTSSCSYSPRVYQYERCGV